MSTKYVPIPWKLTCPWCEWYAWVNPRGARGNDPGSGVEAALLGRRHAEEVHGKTWDDFLASNRDGNAGTKLSAECSRCGSDIVYPPGTWPVGLCSTCTRDDRIDELEDALLYALGYDIAGWPGHLRPAEILECVGVDPVLRSTHGI